jgi:hypothetical protein
MGSLGEWLPQAQEQTMKRVLACIILFCLAHHARLHAQDTAPPAAGQILSLLVDEEDQATAPGRAVVFLCDAATGRPLVAANRRPLNTDNPVEGPSALWHAETDADGSFAFDEVPPGEYRLFAQAWVGIEGLPENIRDASEMIQLLGVAEGVRVAAGETVRTYLRPAGAGSLTVNTDPKEESAFLLLSTAAPLGDPVLGPAGWHDPFLRGLIGVTHLTKSHATFLGVPEHGELYASALFYDNVPGVGTALAPPGRERTATLRIFSGWSNAHKDPPARLLPLVEHLEAGSTTLGELLGVAAVAGRNDEDSIRAIVLADPARAITVPGVGEFPAVDVLAAQFYVNLRKTKR